MPRRRPTTAAGQSSIDPDVRRLRDAIALGLAAGPGVGFCSAGQIFAGDALAGAATAAMALSRRFDGLAGDSAANVLQGGGGDDVLNGLGGNDVIEGGDGADVLQGGDEIDTLSYASARARVTTGLTPNMPRNGDAFLDRTPLWDFENITGSGYDDAISGNAITPAEERSSRCRPASQWTSRA